MTTETEKLNIEEPAMSSSSADESTDEVLPPKKRKRGIVYISNLPKHMNVTLVREMFSNFGTVMRIFLQPEVVPESKKKKRKERSKFSRHFTEGWVEFERKKVAKYVGEHLNNKQISSSKKSRFYDDLWHIKYLPRFKWVHLSERLSYEKAVFKQKLRTEISQAKKEAEFFQNNLDKSEHLHKIKKKKIKNNDSNDVSE